MINGSGRHQYAIGTAFVANLVTANLEFRGPRGLEKASRPPAMGPISIETKRTAVGENWIAERLAMGHPGSLSRMLGAMPKNRSWGKRLRELGKMLGSGD